MVLGQRLASDWSEASVPACDDRASPPYRRLHRSTAPSREGGFVSLDRSYRGLGRTVASAAFGLCIAVAGPVPAAAQFVSPIPYEKYTLPNGLEVILAEDHSVPIVAVNTWYKVGSGD